MAEPDISTWTLEALSDSYDYIVCGAGESGSVVLSSWKRDGAPAPALATG